MDALSDAVSDLARSLEATARALRNLPGVGSPGAPTDAAPSSSSQLPTDVASPNHQCAREAQSEYGWETLLEWWRRLSREFSRMFERHQLISWGPSPTTSQSLPNPPSAGSSSQEPCRPLPATI